MIIDVSVKVKKDGECILNKDEDFVCHDFIEILESVGGMMYRSIIKLMSNVVDKKDKGGDRNGNICEDQGENSEDNRKVG